MITYYNDRAVRVTSQAIQVAGRSYPLATLSRVWHRRGDRSLRTVAGRGAIGVALISPLVAAAIGIVVALRLHTSTATTVLIVGGSVLVGLAAAPLADFLLGRLDLSYSKGSRALEIWAEVGGRPTLLVQTADALKFGQIYRALQRALEAAPRY
ncbi:hypothetical protein DFJ67_3680 [Asanoa ferruginea]|uniref:Uncharacterized protein n=1 Tax=Asanoa ferruginea TaxID=53367 RepID=A0A3D9ZJS2_9ACTN|nr:DUF6232 family protein [Asanoa ferruginea]REF97676.1 hypothetical protein DFJ67_3680 [Asanoa ferruginea]GIF52409.1 hypothetical protein Afe04nite_69480 [Asanoa ferruginea]